MFSEITHAMAPWEVRTDMTACTEVRAPTRWDRKINPAIHRFRFGPRDFHLEARRRSGWNFIGATTFNHTLAREPTRKRRRYALRHIWEKPHGVVLGGAVQGRASQQRQVHDSPYAG